MYKGNRLIATAIGMLAFVAVAISGCQTQDGSLPTEAGRSVELSATADEIHSMIAGLLPKGLANAASAQFKNVVRQYPTDPAGGVQKAQSLMDFILKHYLNGKWVDPEGVETAELIAAIAAYVGIIPDADAAVVCSPGVDCEVAEFAGGFIPGDVITTPFILYISRLPDDFAGLPLVPLFFDIGTIPEGITFPETSPGGSLSLSQSDDGPFAAVCALDENDPLGVPPGTVPGENLFLAHFENGEWVTLPYVEPPVGFIDCAAASSEIETALWMRPFEFAASLLSPNSLHAGGRGLGGAISSFSAHAGILTGPVATTTTISIVEEQTTFFDGETITFRAVVDPAPDNASNGIVVFTATDPPHGPGAPTEEVVDGEAVQTFVCGSTRVPFGSHTAQAFFLGTAGHSASTSDTLEYECLASEGE